MTIEMNFDGLVGPTHNYAGLSYGNVAAMSNKGLVSNPKAAALQGLKKMRALLELGLAQGVFPPHERPLLPALKNLGFKGADAQMLETAWAFNKQLVANLSSASPMWAANAATVSPSVDCEDGRVHFTPANLISMPHRSFEAETTKHILETIFFDDDHFVIHEPLPANMLFSDEGAANHNRLCAAHDEPGVEAFVYGRIGLDRSHGGKFPGRQTREAGEMIMNRHSLRHDNTIHVPQSVNAIDAGAFHNDVVCVTNENIILCHEYAFENLHETKATISQIGASCGFNAQFIVANDKELPLKDAVTSYFFNSQLVTLPDNTMALILPSDSEENTFARQFADKCLADDNPIQAIHFFDLRESMQNGGGPACLRLRVPLTKTQMEAIHQPMVMTEAKLDQLESWVQTHYRDRLKADDLRDPHLIVETQAALDELTQLLSLGSFYQFQQEQSH